MNKVTLYPLLFTLYAVLPTGTADAKGRQPGDGDFDVPKPLQGSAANPNPSYKPPEWDYERPSKKGRDEAPKKKEATSAQEKKKIESVPVEAPAPEKATDFSQPQPAESAPPLSSDSLEPPLPDEPGGDPDKRTP